MSALGNNSSCYNETVLYHKLPLSILLNASAQSWARELPRYCQVTPESPPICCSQTWKRHHIETRSALLAIFYGKLPLTGGLPSQRASNAELWCCLSEYAVKQTVKLPMITNIISHRVTSLAPGQLYDYPSIREVTLKDTGKIHGLYYICIYFCDTCYLICSFYRAITVGDYYKAWGWLTRKDLWYFVGDTCPNVCLQASCY